MQLKTGVLLINVGTPDSPAVYDVRRYLTQFLNDKYVIDLPWFKRTLLVNGIIVPFRARNSAKLYRELWTEEGSPLIIHGQQCANDLNEELGADFIVRLAMRYQNPSIESALMELKGKIGRLMVVPLYPQYAESSTRTSIERTQKMMKRVGMDVPTTFVKHFHEHPKFLTAFANRIEEAEKERFDHVLFSFHGLPERQLVKLHASKHPCDGCACEQREVPDIDNCYKAQCYATVRALVQRCGLKDGDYSVGFQSRLDQKWLKPFSDELLPKLAKQGVRRLLVVSPAFVADCLETSIEIGVEYKEIFEKAGGDELRLVESLNAEPLWVEALSDLVRAKIS